MLDDYWWGSCTNVVSTLLVEKLGLPTTKHSHPYELQWFSDRDEVKVNLQARIMFNIGKFSNEVVCDVVLIEAGHCCLDARGSMIDILHIAKRVTNTCLPLIIKNSL